MSLIFRNTRRNYVPTISWIFSKELFEERIKTCSSNVPKKVSFGREEKNVFLQSSESCKRHFGREAKIMSLQASESLQRTVWKIWENVAPSKLQVFEIDSLEDNRKLCSESFQRNSWRKGEKYVPPMFRNFTK